MISLDTKEYCHDCPNFEPEVQTVYYDNSVQHIIRCSNMAHCQAIEQHLKKSIKTEETIFDIKLAT